jgi:hypothetical protein
VADGAWGNTAGSRQQTVGSIMTKVGGQTTEDRRQIVDFRENSKMGSGQAKREERQKVHGTRRKEGKELTSCGLPFLLAPEFPGGGISPCSCQSPRFPDYQMDAFDLRIYNLPNVSLKVVGNAEGS